MGTTTVRVDGGPNVQVDPDEDFVPTVMRLARDSGINKMDVQLTFEDGETSIIEEESDAPADFQGIKEVRLLKTRDLG